MLDDELAARFARGAPGARGLDSNEFSDPCINLGSPAPAAHTANATNHNYGYSGA